MARRYGKKTVVSAATACWARGAYFAPELGNVWHRYDGYENAEAARAGIEAWIKAQPLGTPGRRQMPNFDLDEKELDALVDFFQWTDSIDTQDWPPHVSG